MSSKLMRLGALAGSAALLAGAIAWAQDRNAVQPSGRAGDEIFVFNPVEGRITVLSAQPDGVQVEKGAVVCELDPTELQDRQNSQKLTVASAEAVFRSARLAREVAEIAVLEYKEGIFVQDLATSEGEIKLAESDLLRAEDNLEWSRCMYDKGYQSMAAKVSDELKFKKAQFARTGPEQAQGPGGLHQEEDDQGAGAGASRRPGCASWPGKRRFERERSASMRLDSQIQGCKVVAPVGGRIHYGAPMGAGAVLRDGQAICRIETDAGPATPTK